MGGNSGQSLFSRHILVCSEYSDDFNREVRIRAIRRTNKLDVDWVDVSWS